MSCFSSCGKQLRDVHVLKCEQSLAFVSAIQVPTDCLVIIDLSCVIWRCVVLVCFTIHAADDIFPSDPSCNTDQGV